MDSLVRGANSYSSPFIMSLHSGEQPDAHHTIYILTMAKLQGQSRCEPSSELSSCCFGTFAGMFGGTSRKDDEMECLIGGANSL